MKRRDTFSAKDAARAGREKRLAEALRANLRRRKSAAEAKSSERTTDTPDGGPEKSPNSGKSQG